MEYISVEVLSALVAQWIISPRPSKMKVELASLYIYVGTNVFPACVAISSIYSEGVCVVSRRRLSLEVPLLDACMAYLIIQRNKKGFCAFKITSINKCNDQTS